MATRVTIDSYQLEMLLDKFDRLIAVIDDLATAVRELHATGKE